MDFDRAWCALVLTLLVAAALAAMSIALFYESYLARHVRDRDEAIEQADAHARYAATHDTLTGLPNRQALTTAVEEAIADVRGFALMVLNVDRLKAINDLLGHQAVDQFLCELSRRPKAVLRRTDVPHGSPAMNSRSSPTSCIELGCDQYQGFFCSPAVPADAFVKLLARLRAERPELSEADMLRTQSRLSAFTPETAG